MKRLINAFLAIVIISASVQAIAQNTKDAQNEIKMAKKEARKLEKAARKNEEELRLNENYDKIVAQIKDSAFVIETHTLYNRYNQPIPVSPNTNFVMVDGDFFTLQVANDYGLGANGLGGITLDGRISNYEVLSNKDNGPVKLRIDFSNAVIGSSTIFITASRSGSSKANVSGGFGAKISFGGLFKDLDESRVYKGTTSY